MDGLTGKTMRILALALCSLGLLGSGIAAAEDAAGAKAQFVKAASMIRGGQKLLAGYGDHLYFAAISGVDPVIAVTGLDGKLQHTFPAKGDVSLRRPEAVTEEAGVVYVADSDLNQVLMFTTAGKFLGKLGAKKGGLFGGSSAAELDKPLGVAVREGVVYVLDGGSRRIMMFGVNGVFAGALELKPAPNKSSEVYKLRTPVDIKLDAAGRIYVLDKDDFLVKVYTPDGVFVRALPDEGALLGFAIARDGVYLAKNSDLSIHKYDFNNHLMYRFGMGGDAEGQFSSWSGMVALQDKQVLVADVRKGVVDYFAADQGVALEPVPHAASRPFAKSTGQYQILASKLAWNGKDGFYGVDPEQKALVIVQHGKVEGQIRIKDVVPVSVAFDKNGAAWVLDKGGRVIKLDAAGKMVGSFGSAGSGDGQFDEPTDLVIASSGKIFVADRGNDSVQVFDGDGKFLRAVRKLDNPMSIAVDDQDNVFVLGKGANYVAIYSDQGALVGKVGEGKEGRPGSLDSPVALTANADELMVADGNQIKVYTHGGEFLRSFGAKGSELGELSEPVAIALVDDASFLVAERGNKRVQSFETEYKPAAPQNLAATDGLHSITLNWAPISRSYIKQYQVYRSKDENSGYTHVATLAANQYVDRGLEAEGKYFYRIAAETRSGYEGATSAAVSAVSRRYTPPKLDSVQVDVSSWQLKLSWKPIQSEFVNSYYIYQQDANGTAAKIGEVLTPEYTREGLTPNTKYTYYVAAHSSDGTEGEKYQVDVTTPAFSKAPLEIEVLKVRPIFSNTYKLYQDDGLGMVRLTNNTNKMMEGVTFSFKVNEFMDFATESKLDKLAPGQSADIKLKAVFNNNILNVTEDTAVQTMLEASYFDNGKRESYSKTLTVNVYEKHKLLWDEGGRYASFITPKDTPVLAFVRSVATQYKEVKDESQLAAIVFNALGVYGLTYIPDPANPYQVTSGKVDTVDYIQFPRETLERKSGDCDDLVAFYTSALESMGIATRVIEVPGHMFMMFSTGVDADADGYTMDDMYVIYQGKLWIPVETTAVGKSFVKAWELGAAAYYKWKDKGLTLLDVQQAWETYKPASLQEAKWKPAEVNKDEVEKQFPGEFTAMLKISSQTRTRYYHQRIEKNPSDADAYLQIGITLAKMADRVEAMKYFDKVLSLQPNNAAAMNNRGNLYMIDDQYSEAQKAYLEASRASPDDPYIWINLAKANKALKQFKEAKDAYMKAQNLDPGIKKKYKALGLELSNTL